MASAHHSNTIADERLLDAQGLFCPEPVMMLHSTIREMAIGDIVKVIATDPSTQRDIPKFCQFLNHELLEKATEQDGVVFIYRIRKAERKPG